MKTLAPNVTFENEVAVPATQALKRGRQKGSKVEHFVTAEEYVPVLREMCAQGKSLEEIASRLNISKATVLQKRLSYNKRSAEAGYPLNLPMPISIGHRGAKKIDWSKFATKVEDSVS